MSGPRQQAPVVFSVGPSGFVEVSFREVAARSSKCPGRTIWRRARAVRVRIDLVWRTFLARTGEGRPALALKVAAPEANDLPSVEGTIQGGADVGRSSVKAEPDGRLGEFRPGWEGNRVLAGGAVIGDPSHLSQGHGGARAKKQRIDTNIANIASQRATCRRFGRTAAAATLRALLLCSSR